MQKINAANRQGEVVFVGVYHGSAGSISDRCLRAACLICILDASEKEYECREPGNDELTGKSSKLQGSA